jgi:DNA primase
MDNIRSVMNNPMKKRELAGQVVQALKLKIKTRNLANADEWQCTCPFHTDKTPSMYIAPEKFVYHCFSCQAQGSLSSLYYTMTGRSFYKDYNIVHDEFTAFSFDTTPYIEPDYSKLDRDIHITISGDILPVDKSPEASRYLRKRGITFEVAKAMGMGFMKHGHINGTTFRDRLVIPIMEGGNMLSLEGRDVTGQQSPKVLYPKDSTVQTLYDIDVLDHDKPLYVVEGLMDLAVLRTDPFFANSTAIFGAGINERQIWLLNQFNNVVVIPDSDEAGMRSVRRLKENLKDEFYILEVPKLGGLKDVGDIPQKLHTTVEDFRRRGWGRSLKSSLSLIFY